MQHLLGQGAPPQQPLKNLQKAVRLGSTDPNAAVATAGPLGAGDALNVIPEHAQIGISAVFRTGVRQRPQERIVQSRWRAGGS